jgi:hypothetical protein
MSQVEMITALPNWRWKDKSREEIDLTGEELLKYSDFIWKLGNIIVMGLIYSSFTSPPWAWFLLADDIKFSDLVDLRRATDYIPSGAMTAVQSDFTVGLRFAKFYGFVETGQTAHANSREYVIMRKV